MGSPCTRINIEHVTLNMNIQKKNRQTSKLVKKTSKQGNIEKPNEYNKNT